MSATEPNSVPLQEFLNSFPTRTMSGFRDFNVSQMAKQTKTLASSMEEDDWDTGDFDDVARAAESLLAPAPADVKSTPERPIIPIASHSVGQIKQTLSTPTVHQKPKPPVPVKPLHQAFNSSENNNSLPAPVSTTSKTLDGIGKAIGKLEIHNDTPAALAGPRKSIDDIKKSMFTVPSVSQNAVSKPAPVLNRDPKDSIGTPRTITVNLNSSTNQPSIASSTRSESINANALAERFKIFTPSEITAFYQQFDALDKDNNRKFVLK
jgi:hypothetical protein